MPKEEAQTLEKRIAPRGTLRTRVVFEDESGEGFIYFYTTDVSSSGIFLESDVPLKIGTRIFISFSLKETDPPIRTVGRVVRIERDPGESLYSVGMGIQFVDFPDEAKKRIEEFVE